MKTESVEYNQETGELFKINSKGVKSIVSDVNFYGYLRLSYKGKRILAHRLICELMGNDLKDMQVDHINGIRSDNRWCNLRIVSHQENQKNLKQNIRNKSGHTGICWDRKNFKWQVQLIINKKNIKVGRYKELSDAIIAKSIAYKFAGYHENHGDSKRTGTKEQSPWLC